MVLQLTDIEARVLGSLVEKSLTTPAQYPLSLNSLTLACNQKTSRDPVMDLDESTVARTLSTLQQKELAYTKSESNNRVPKFGHRIENLLQGGTSKEVGAICVLLLRGPQTPGEIKTRTDRLCEYESTAEVETILNDLASRSDGPYVARLARQPGQKEARFQHLFSGEPAAPKETPKPASAFTAAKSSAPTLLERMAQLEARITALETRLK